MPRERITDEYMKRFEMPAPQPRPNQRPVSIRAWSLVASRSYPPKSIVVSFPVWSDIIRLVEKNGYRCPDATGGLGREHVALFAKALLEALSKEEVDDELRDAASRVLDFVEGPANCGFRMQSRFTQ